MLKHLYAKKEKVKSLRKILISEFKLDLKKIKFNNVNHSKYDKII